MMTQADYGRVGNRIKNQYAYLERFAKRIKSGAVSRIATESRARTYASAIYISYSDTLRETKTEDGNGDGNSSGRDGQIYAELVQNSQEGCEECAADAAAGPQPVEDVAPIGDRLCNEFCLCFLIFTDADGNEV